MMMISRRRAFAEITTTLSEFMSLGNLSCMKTIEVEQFITSCGISIAMVNLESFGVLSNYLVEISGIY